MKKTQITKLLPSILISIIMVLSVSAYFGFPDELGYGNNGQRLNPSSGNLLGVFYNLEQSATFNETFAGSEPLVENFIGDRLQFVVYGNCGILVMNTSMSVIFSDTTVCDENATIASITSVDWNRDGNMDLFVEKNGISIQNIAIYTIKNSYLQLLTSFPTFDNFYGNKPVCIDNFCYAMDINNVVYKFGHNPLSEQTIGDLQVQSPPFTTDPFSYDIQKYLSYGQNCLGNGTKILFAYGDFDNTCNVGGRVGALGTFDYNCLEDIALIDLSNFEIWKRIELTGAGNIWSPITCGIINGTSTMAITTLHKGRHTGGACGPGLGDCPFTAIYSSFLYNISGSSISYLNAFSDNGNGAPCTANYCADPVSVFSVHSNFYYISQAVYGIVNDKICYELSSPNVALTDKISCIGLTGSQVDLVALSKQIGANAFNCFNLNGSLISNQEDVNVGYGNLSYHPRLTLNRLTNESSQCGGSPNDKCGFISSIGQFFDNFPVSFLTQPTVDTENWVSFNDLASDSDYAGRYWNFSSGNTWDSCERPLYKYAAYYDTFGVIDQLPFLIDMFPNPTNPVANINMNWLTTIGDDSPTPNVTTAFDCDNNGILDYDWGHRGLTPTFTCDYTSAGSYTARIFMSDDFHPDSNSTDSRGVIVTSSQVVNPSCAGFVPPLCTGQCVFYDNFNYNYSITCNGWEGIEIFPELDQYLHLSNLSNNNALYLDFAGGEIASSQFSTFIVTFNFRKDDNSLNFMTLNDRNFDKLLLNLRFENGQVVAITSIAPTTRLIGYYNASQNYTITIIGNFPDQSFSINLNGATTDVPFFDSAVTSVGTFNMGYYDRILLDFYLDDFQISHGAAIPGGSSPQNITSYAFNGSMFCAINWNHPSTQTTGWANETAANCASRGYPSTPNLLGICIIRACFADSASYVFRGATGNFLMTILLVTVFIILAPLAISLINASRRRR